MTVRQLTPRISTNLARVPSAVAGVSTLVACGLTGAPVLAADPIKLSLGGFLQTFITAGKIDGDVVGTIGISYRSVTFRYEGEIWFSGSTKLDNGTTIGIRIELEAWSQNTGISAANTTGTADQIDEEYVFAFGSWGRLELGAADAASVKMTYSTQSALIGWGFQDPSLVNKGIGFLAANHGGRSGTTTGLSASLTQSAGDSNKITYISPRVAGFQVGGSYAPAMSVGFGTARCGFRGGGANITNCPRSNNSWKNATDVAANYERKFGDVTVRLHGGYMTAAFDRGTLTPDGLVGAPNNAARRWKSGAAGGQLAYRGFTLGGGLGRDNNGLRRGNATRWYAASLFYESGPWQASVAWWGGRNNDGLATVAGAQNAPGRDKQDVFEVGVNYLLSPGIKLNGGLNYVKGSGQSKSERADAWALIFGTVFTF
ncbi:MAG TPA: porin [Vineibacter sp.]|nr:porin [Vineibacter sp.]